MEISDYRDVECYYVAETKKAFLLKLMDDNEYWFPKTQVRDVEKGNGLQMVQISEWIIGQKGLKNILGGSVIESVSEEPFESAVAGKCENCGGDVDNPNYRLCRSCYFEHKNQVKEDLYPKNTIGIKGYCENCGHDIGIEGKDTKVYCERCGIKLADGTNDWINTLYKCEKCGEGIYEPYGYFVLKCNRCNYMKGVNPIVRKNNK